MTLIGISVVMLMSNYIVMSNYIALYIQSPKVEVAPVVSKKADDSSLLSKDADVKKI
jgi:hypothetical protein